LTDFLITVVYEIARPPSKSLRGKFTEAKALQSEHATTVSRLLGRRLESSSAFKSSHTLDAPSTIHDRLVAAKVIYIRNANSILSLTFELTAETLEKADGYRRVKSSAINSICNTLGLQLESGHYVYGVAASSSNLELDFESQVRDCWMHCQASTQKMFITHQVHAELALRIAIERAVIAKALDDPANSMARWIRAPFAGRLVRTLPVELLIDSQETMAAYKEMRNRMNLQNLRDEVLDRARLWYLSVGTAITFTALLVGIIGLWDGIL
jgi:hypothetical protein